MSSSVRIPFGNLAMMSARPAHKRRIRTRVHRWIAIALLEIAGVRHVAASSVSVQAANGLANAVSLKEVGEVDQVVITDLSQGGRVGIDSLIQITIDDLELTRTLQASLPGVPADELSALAQRLAVLDQALQLTGSASDAFAALGPALKNKTPAEVRSLLSASPEGRRFVQSGGTLFTLVDASRSALGPALVTRINKILEAGEPQSEFRAMASLLATELKRLDAELRTALQQRKFAFGLIANHYTVGGKKEAVRLEGYTDTQACTPTVFERFDLLPDERAKQEVSFASKLAPFANDLLSGRYKEQAQSLLGEIKALLPIIRDDLRSQALDSLIPKLRAVATARPNVQLLLVRWDRLGALLKDLEAAASQTTATDSGAFLLAIGSSAASFLSSVEDSAIALPRLVQDVEHDLINAAGDLDEVLKGELTKAVRDLKSRIATLAPTLTRLAGFAGDLKDLYNQAQMIREPATRLSEQAKRLNLGLVRDTQVRLQTLCLKRSPGDGIQLAAFLYDPDGKVLAEREFWYRLDVYGAFVETRGFLAFADPRGQVKGAEGALAPPSFAAAPGLGWFVHYTDRKWLPFFNDTFRPGFGVSLLALNFKRQSALEVGISAGAVLLKDLVHVGYGRNLQAKVNFFYVGINPLAFGQLFGQASAAPPQAVATP